MANLSRLTTIIFYQSIYFLVASYSTSHLAIFFQSFPTFFASPHYSNISSYVFLLIILPLFFFQSFSSFFDFFLLSIISHLTVTIPSTIPLPFLLFFFSSYFLGKNTLLVLIFWGNFHFDPYVL